MPVTQTEIQRLAFIKYLHRLGDEQTKMSEPLCSISILSYHDSVELFLGLITDKLSITKTTPHFIDYWDLIGKKSVPSYRLSHKNEMSRLNKNRVQLKHYGIYPSKLAIDEAKIFLNLFFEENTKLIFGLDYSQISLVDLVTFESTKNFRNNSLLGS
ncbi:MAG: hypothetical protein Q7U51_11420 [Methanoregula sp.]|nr:hypothetical protein [Methanoregula sp.]